MIKTVMVPRMAVRNLVEGSLTNPGWKQPGEDANTALFYT